MVVSVGQVSGGLGFNAGGGLKTKRPAGQAGGPFWESSDVVKVQTKAINAPGALLEVVAVGRG